MARNTPKKNHPWKMNSAFGNMDEKTKKIIHEENDYYGYKTSDPNYTKKQKAKAHEKYNTL